MFIVPVGVVRKVTEQGAELSRVVVLDNHQDGESVFWPEGLDTDPKQWDWDVILSQICRGTDFSYFTPWHVFHKGHIDHEDVLTYVYPVVIDGPEGDWLEESCGLGSALENTADLKEVFRLPMALADQASKQPKIGFIALSALATAVCKLNIPPTIPFGKCEFDCASNETGTATAGYVAKRDRSGRVLFEPGAKVQIKEGGLVIDTVQVVSDLRSELTIERTDEAGKPTGARETFAFDPQCGGWALLFEGLGGERCIGSHGPRYEITPA